MCVGESSVTRQVGGGARRSRLGRAKNAVNNGEWAQREWEDDGCALRLRRSHVETGRC